MYFDCLTATIILATGVIVMLFLLRAPCPWKTYKLNRK